MAPSSAFENHGSAGGVPGIISCEIVEQVHNCLREMVLPPQWINIDILDKRMKFKPRKLQSSMSNSSSPETEATQLRCVLQDFGETQFNVSYFMASDTPVAGFCPDSIWELGACAARFWTFKTILLPTLCRLFEITLLHRSNHTACLCCSHCLSMRRTESNSGRNAVTQVITICLWFQNLSCFSKT